MADQETLDDKCGSRKPKQQQERDVAYDNLIQEILNEPRRRSELPEGYHVCLARKPSSAASIYRWDISVWEQGSYNEVLDMVKQKYPEYDIVHFRQAW